MEDQKQTDKQVVSHRLAFTPKEWHKQLLSGLGALVIGALIMAVIYSLGDAGKMEFLKDPTGLTAEAMNGGTETAQEIAKLKVELEDNSQKLADIDKQRDDMIIAINAEHDERAMPYLENIEHTGGEIQRLKDVYKEQTGKDYDGFQ